MATLAKERAHKKEHTREDKRTNQQATLNEAKHDSGNVGYAVASPVTLCFTASADSAYERI